MTKRMFVYKSKQFEHSDMFMTFTEIVSDYAWLASDQNNVLSLNKTSDVINCPLYFCRQRIAK